MYVKLIFTSFLRLVATIMLNLHVHIKTFHTERLRTYVNLCVVTLATKYEIITL